MCIQCENTGVYLRSNGKIPVLEINGENIPNIPVSEPLIKCSCEQK